VSHNSLSHNAARGNALSRHLAVGGWRTRAVAAIATTLLTVSGLAASPASAAVATFGEPSARASFGTDIVFDQPVDLQAPPSRVEVLISFPGAAGPLVTEVPAPSGAGHQALRYRLLIADGHISPNTRVTARWRLTAGAATQIGPPVSVLYTDTRFDWQTRKGDIVRIHWYQGDDAFGRRAMSIAEAGVAKAEELFGVTETEPIDFFVYASQVPFYDALGPGTRENVGGQAQADIRTMFALITPGEINDAWVANVLPHELTHLVFNTAVKNPYHFPPRWLNEGLAVYLAQGYGADDRALVRGAARDGGIMPLASLTGQFPTTRDRFFLAYSESVSAVDYLIRTYGRPALVKLVRSYAAGVTDDEAFKAALGIDATAFGTAWLKEVGASAPKSYGPQPAPPGPLPPGWSADESPALPVATPPGAAVPSDTRTNESGTPAATQLDTGTVAVALAIVAAILGLSGLAVILLSRRSAR
jgi:hypothetical protein